MTFGHFQSVYPSAIKKNSFAKTGMIVIGVQLDLWQLCKTLLVTEIISNITQGFLCSNRHNPMTHLHSRTIMMSGVVNFKT